MTNYAATTKFSPAWATAFTLATALTLPMAAQQGVPSPATAPTADTTTQTDANTPAQASATLTNAPNAPKKKKAKVAKTDRVVQSKDTVAENKKAVKLDPLAGKDATLPDKTLYDKAIAQTKSGHFDVARLDLQTLLNTYPDSQYQMRSKLAIADSWYREGGTAALTQAEQEYTDFITFFPNAPEAAEAQMRVGDIYFKQMDVPDRDFSKSVKAEDAYRLMLKQYPDSTLIPEARQKLREVQEVMATREADLGAFYATHANWSASIARLQTVVDTYPQYSHMDDTLIGIGDAYAAEARLVRERHDLPEGPRAKLLQNYDGKAATAYRKVVLEHSAAPHVEDAKERLESMGLPVPTPTAEQLAASEALEGSRAQYNLQKRMMVLFMHRPDVVLAARAGDPPLDDPAATTAPTINADLIASFKTALGVAPEAPVKPTATDTSDTPSPAPVAPVTTAPLALQDVAGPGSDPGTGNATPVTAAPADASRPAGNSLGVEVLTPGTTSSVNPKSTAADTNNGLHAVGPENTTALPPVEKPADAPDQINDAAGKPQPAGQVVPPGQKAPKAPVDKEDESSSKKKPKKGLDKINPF